MCNRHIIERGHSSALWHKPVIIQKRIRIQTISELLESILNECSKAFVESVRRHDHL